MAADNDSWASAGSIPFKKAGGEATCLNEFKGKIVLIVNVASKCGLTPQYEGLEKIYEKYRARGFEVLAFPANEFGAQEPGTNAEIQDFCRMNFGVQFPVLQKVVVKGEGQHPLFKSLTSTYPHSVKKPSGTLEKRLAEHGLLTGAPSEIRWNFEKFLVDREGRLIGRFSPEIAPQDPELIQAVEKALT